jgi:hypothetical protein
MALDDLARVGVVQVHGSTEAVLIDFAALANSSFHPATVAERLETVFPNVEEVILVDVALDKQLPVDVGTS